jgi:glycosyltransferase involved in cell wall biosynthesis
MTNRPRDPLLSVLITTYNRSFFLGKCLESIERALSNCRHAKNFEVIVFNNGCTDDTSEVISRFESTLPLKGLHEKSNIGFINGLRRCIDSAKGRYCWFLGDDDYIVLENLDPLIGYLEQEAPDILLLNHYSYIYENDKPKFLMKGNGRYLMKRSKDCYDTHRDYILNARHPAAFFSHIAPVIFRRDEWFLHFSEEAMERFARSYSGHFFIFMSLLKSAKRICYYKEQSIALCFGAPSDSMLTEDGRYYRFLMGAEYFLEMFESVFPEKDLVKHFKGVFLKYEIVVLLLGSKIRGRFSLGFYRRLLKLLYTNYRSHPFFWYGIIPLLATPRIFFVLAYRWFLKKP